MQNTTTIPPSSPRSCRLSVVAPARRRFALLPFVLLLRDCNTLSVPFPGRLSPSTLARDRGAACGEARCSKPRTPSHTASTAAARERARHERAGARAAAVDGSLGAWLKLHASTRISTHSYACNRALTKASHTANQRHASKALRERSKPPKKCSSPLAFAAPWRSAPNLPGAM